MKKKKQINAIEDQRKKTIEALKDLIPEEQTKAIEDKTNKIFNRLLGKKLMKYKKQANKLILII